MWIKPGKRPILPRGVKKEGGGGPFAQSTTSFHLDLHIDTLAATKSLSLVVLETGVGYSTTFSHEDASRPRIVTTITTIAT